MEHDFRAILMGEEEKVRRFRIETDRNDHKKVFSLIKSKLKQLFPILNDHQYTCYWKDEYGLIILESEQDYKIFHESKLMNNTYNIFIKLNKTKEQVVHSGVICDVCNKRDIQGNRYKCLTCHDFDICNGCEEKGLHDNHAMIRIAHPNQLSYGIFQNLGLNSGDHSKRHSQHNYKKKCPFYSEGQNCNDETKFHKNTSESKKEKPTKKCPKSSTKIGSIDLKDIFDFVLPFLDPLNIKIPINDPLQQFCSTSNENSEHPSKDTQNTTSCKEKDTVNETQKNTNESETNPKNDAEVIPQNIINHENSIADDQDKLPEKIKEVEGWTLLSGFAEKNAEKNGSQDTKPTTSAESEKNHNNEVEDGIKHLNPKIQQAVLKMKEMGFNIQEDWLLNLLISKDGNIDKVLNMIYASN